MWSEQSVNQCQAMHFSLTSEIYFPNSSLSGQNGIDWSQESQAVLNWVYVLHITKLSMYDTDFLTHQSFLLNMGPRNKSRTENKDPSYISGWVITQVAFIFHNGRNHIDTNLYIWYIYNLHQTKPCERHLTECCQICLPNCLHSRTMTWEDKV